MRGFTVGLLLLATALAGCDRDGSKSSPTGGGGSGDASANKFRVLASVHPMADMANRVGGGWVEAQWLVDAGRRPEEVEEDLARQRAADAVAVITAGPWDGWAIADLSAEARGERVIEPARMPSARADGREADANAYLWLDAGVVRDMADRLRVRLTVIEPRREADLRSGMTAYLAEVDAADREARAILADLKGRKVLVVRPVWGAMLARYGLEQVAPVPAAREERLTAADFKERIVPAARANGLKAIFVDEATPAAVRQQIEDRTGLEVLALDAVGTSAPAGRNSWARVLLYNAAQISKGLEAK